MGKRSSFKRRKADKYPTPYKPIRSLLPHLSGVRTFVEPCAGDGRLVRHLESHGLACVDAFDVLPECTTVRIADAFTEPLRPADVIITNPPWTREILHPMIERFRRHAPTWLLFDSDWHDTLQSADLIRFCSDIQPVGRVRWMEDTDNDGKDNSSWYRFVDHETETKFWPRIQ